jgi:hypothetical protein
MMEAASTSETSVNFYQATWRNNLEDSHLHTRRRENLKSHNPLQSKYNTSQFPHTLAQVGTTFFFPRVKNSFPVGPKGQETPPGTVFEN